MPAIFREAGYRFHFYSHEGNPREPVHIHVTRRGATAKLWLFPDVRLSYNRRMTAHENRSSSVGGRRLSMHGMHISPEPTEVRFDDDVMWVTLEDGRTIGVPIVWFPRLMKATRGEREKFFLSPSGIHWEGLDEDIAVATLLTGRWEAQETARAA